MTCVEVGYSGSQISGEIDYYLVRDSKQVDADGVHTGPVLRFTPEQWAAFLTELRVGNLDGAVSWAWLSGEGADYLTGGVEIRHGRDMTCMRAADDPETVLSYTAEEWAAFGAGVRNGEFDYGTADAA
jgi:hypothetical protein